MTHLEFTSKDMFELIYLLRNAPVDISHSNKRMFIMNGFWYTSIDGILTSYTFENFHDAVCWLLNPFWQEATGHSYE